MKLLLSLAMRYIRVKFQHKWRLKDTPQTASLGPTKTCQQALEVEPIGFIGIFFRFVGSSFLLSSLRG